jgi:kynurenine formamidase
MTGPAKTITDDEIDALFEQCKNWGRWGAEDERGALNYISAEKRAAATGLARRGITVSCALPLATQSGIGATAPVTHYMVQAGDLEDAVGAGDYIAVASHGVSITHLDALCHVFYKGRMYNDRPKSLVTSIGAMANSILSGEDGILSRGVMLDIPRLDGREWLEPGEAIYVEDLEAAEKAQNLRVEEGDILLINTGRHKRRASLSESSFGGDMAGLHASCLPWLQERRVALLGCDGVSDVTPSGWGGPGMRIPVHVVAIPAMGLHLLDNCDLGALADMCRRLNTWEFLFMLAPLRLPRGTASPVNPIAVF